MSGELPTIKEELERKTIETLEWIVQMHETGQITMAQAKVAAQTTFNCVSGLVSSETSSLISDLGINTNAEETIKRVLVGDKGVFVVTWEVGSYDVFVVAKKSGESPVTRKYSKGSPAEAKKSVEEIVTRLSVLGDADEL